MKARKGKIWSAVVVFVLVGGMFLVDVISCGSQAEQTETASPAEVKNEDPFVHIPTHYWEEVIVPLLKERQSAIEALKLEDGAPIADLLREEYEKWLKKAEGSADNGNASYMEAHLTRAGWCVEDANIPEEAECEILLDISEKANAIWLKGYKNAASYKLTLALSCAYNRDETGMRRYLKYFRIYCLEARQSRRAAN